MRVHGHLNSTKNNQPIMHTQGTSADFGFQDFSTDSNTHE